MNIPNKLTMFRMILVIPFVILLKMELNIAACLVFAVASITDFFDGYIARKYNLVTDFGKLMDPLADKVLVLSALIVFVELNYIASWMVIVIITREFLITGIRILAASKGEVIAASKNGKYKTTSQMIAILLIIFTKDSSISLLALNIPISCLLMLLPVYFTVYSGYEYVMNAKHYFK